MLAVLLLLGCGGEDQPEDKAATPSPGVAAGPRERPPDESAPSEPSGKRDTRSGGTSADEVNEPAGGEDAAVGAEGAASGKTSAPKPAGEAPGVLAGVLGGRGGSGSAALPLSGPFVDAQRFCARLSTAEARRRYGSDDPDRVGAGYLRRDYRGSSPELARAGCRSGFEARGARER